MEKESIRDTVGVKTTLLALLVAISVWILITKIQSPPNPYDAVCNSYYNRSSGHPYSKGTEYYDDNNIIVMCRAKDYPDYIVLMRTLE